MAGLMGVLGGAGGRGGYRSLPLDFFGRQQQARRRTLVLVGLFALSVAATIAALYPVVRLFLLLGAFWSTDVASRDIEVWRWWKPELFLWVSLGTLAVIAAGTAWKLVQISKGGAALAARLGGRLVSPRTRDPAKRKLRNVIEEMAIAAGIPVPQLFVIERERGINAFAAGWSPGDAALSVTGGFLAVLRRDEMQGVIAHECAHIVNGDMRLNLRLLGVLFGLQSIGMLGSGMMQMSVSTDDETPGIGSFRLLISGALLAFVGYAGLFFGRLIKAAISREREFLADATAVARALKKIGGASRGSSVRGRWSEEASHMYFASGVEFALFDGLLDTHPPLRNRILRLDPSFDGRYPKVSLPVDEEALARALAPLPRAPTRIPLDAGRVVGLVGAPTVDHLAQGAALLAAIPAELREAARGEGCRALCEALLGSREAAPHLLPHLETLDAGLRLPLAALAAPAIRALPPAAREEFCASLEPLARADGRIDLFEFALALLVRHWTAAARPRVDFWAIAAVREEVGLVLAMLAHHGHHDPKVAGLAFEAGSLPLATKGRQIPLPPPEMRSFAAFEGAMDRLGRASPAVKRRVVEACARCVAHDGATTVAEAELLRVVCDLLDCPLPPLARSQAH